MKIIGTVLFLLTLTCVRSAKILGIFALPGHSHYQLGSAMMRQLAERGHDVTVISCFGEKDPPKNGSYRDVILTGVFEEKKTQDPKDWNMFRREGLNPFYGTFFLSVMAQVFIEKSMLHENVQNLIHSGEKFDVVIMEQFINDAYKALAQHFDANLVILSTVGANHWVNHLVGNPSPPSYVPDILLFYSSHMTFWERLTNSLIFVFNDLLFNFYVFPIHDKLAKKALPNQPNLEDSLYNVSLILLNAHSSLIQPVPYVPKMVEIGGFHLKPPKKLPADLQEFLDNAQEGVIYFSMGSNLESTKFPVEKRDAFVKAFGKLKQKVLWKWEDDVLPGQPSNVKLAKWLPQHDVLAHPNVKLFITHGGYVSSTETAYNGVPVLVIPVYGDQGVNAHFVYENGYGRFIRYRELSEETVLENINEILNNPKYKENSKKRAELFHDRLISPMDTAMYWIEYVVRHGGAPHLKVAGADLPWYRYYLLDVIGFIGTVGASLLVVSCWVLKKICKKFCSKKAKNVKNVKKLKKQ